MVSAQSILILLICIGFLALQPTKVSSLRSIDLVLRWSKEDHGLVLKYQRRLDEAGEMQAMNAEKKRASMNKTFDPNQSSKRRVRRGSNPIHNKS
ncbi:unnamed protein product [Camellia sinensis]